MIFIKFFLFFTLFFSALNASLIITGDSKKYDDFSIQYFYDENSTLTIDDITKKEFTTNISNQFTQGYRYGTAWFKIEIQNQSIQNDFVLSFTESFWSCIDLYSYKNSIWTVNENGLDIPLKQREIEDIFPAFEVTIPSDQSTVFYIRGKTISGQIGAFKLYTTEEFFNPNRMTLWEIYCIYAFILFAFILLNAYNFIITKESIYSYYIAYVLTFIWFTTMQSGLYMSLGFNNWNEGLHVVGAIMLFFLFVFSIKFLELEKNSPFLYKLFRVLSLGFILFDILIQFNVAHSSLLFNIYSSILLLSVFISAINIYRGGYIGAKYYLIALLFYMPAMSLLAFTFNNLIPNIDITRYAYLVGAFIEIFFFTLILTNKYREVSKEKVLAQGALIHGKILNEQKLKSEIEKKTLHLVQANEELTTKTKELEEISKQLTIEATTDMLSGLYNRRYFLESSKNIFYTSVRYQQNLSVLMMDIDNFKNVNDTYGHIFGDKVIRVFSNILKDLSRESDIVARYGGEEFIVLLPQTDIVQAKVLADRICSSAASKEFLLGNEKIFNATVSIGITQLDPVNDVNMEDSITRCDKALYVAKNQGKNRVEIL